MNPFEIKTKTEDDDANGRCAETALPLLIEGEAAEIPEMLDTSQVRKCFSIPIVSIIKITALLILMAGGISLLTLLFFSEHSKEVISRFMIMTKMCRVSDFFGQAAMTMLTSVSELPKGLSMFLVGLIYAAALVFFCPGTPFNLLCGYLFGLYMGSVVAACGCMLGALISFLAGRTIARGGNFHIIFVCFSSIFFCKFHAKM